MSLVLHLAADAQADLRQLDPWLQEEVLDELERLATEPDLVPPVLPGWGSVHAFARASGGVLHIITLMLQRSATQLTALGVNVVSSD